MNSQKLRSGGKGKAVRGSRGSNQQRRKKTSSGGSIKAKESAARGECSTVVKCYSEIKGRDRKTHPLD